MQSQIFCVKKWNLPQFLIKNCKQTHAEPRNTKIKPCRETQIWLTSILKHIAINALTLFYRYSKQTLVSYLNNLLDPSIAQNLGSCIGTSMEGGKEGSSNFFFQTLWCIPSRFCIMKYCFTVTYSGTLNIPTEPPHEGTATPCQRSIIQLVHSWRSRKRKVKDKSKKTGKIWGKLGEQSKNWEKKGRGPDTHIRCTRKMEKGRG